MKDEHIKSAEALVASALLSYCTGDSRELPPFSAIPAGRRMLLDEPSMGLAPVLVREIFQTLREINDTVTTILLVEQNTRQALKLAHRGYVLETSRITLAGMAKDLMDKPNVKPAYLGG